MYSLTQDVDGAFVPVAAVDICFDLLFVVSMVVGSVLTAKDVATVCDGGDDDDDDDGDESRSFI